MTDDMTVWTSTGGPADRARWQGGIRLLASLFPQGLAYRIGSLDAAAHRIVAAVLTEGTLSDGTTYANRGTIVLQPRDGRIAAVCEDFLPGPVREQIAPLIRAAMAGNAG